MAKGLKFKKKSLCPDKCKYFLLIEKANDINVNNKQDEKNADDAEKILWIIFAPAGFLAPEGQKPEEAP